MSPNQDKSSNGKKIEQIIAHNYFVFYSCIESTHKPGSDTTVGERSNNSKFSYVSPRSITEMLATRERRESIFIPLKIAKQKRYKNAVDGVVLAVIQIAEDPIKRRTDGASAFNTRTARGRLLLLDPARGEEKLRENSSSTTAWWWKQR